ncbi:MAG: YccF domain-containing protein [Oscillospiraceae bacterium]|nr:YccF domain-containing protein [Oscillospiraceae bacterium]
MSFLGNLLWFIFCGLLLALLWGIVGLIWCCTVVGIPVGVQCFKLAGLCLAPFGKQIVFGGGAGSALLNILWLVFGGIELAISCAAIGLALCLTIIGIPFGKQCFKLAQLALMPFGAKVV